MSFNPQSSGGFREALKKFKHRVRDKIQSSSDLLSPSQPTITPSLNASTNTASVPPSHMPPTLPQPAAQPVYLSQDRPHPGLRAALHVLRQSANLLPSLGSLIDPFAEMIQLMPTSGSQQDYKELASNLTIAINDFGQYLQECRSPRVSGCVESVIHSLQKEIVCIVDRQTHRAGNRYARIVDEMDDLAKSYHRIGVMFQQLHNNIMLSILGVLDEQLVNSRLDNMHPATSARYDFGNAAELGRRQCTPDTRVQVLNNLQVWANDCASPKIYWMNGMAGTGKTTIACTLCAELDKTHRLAASFFCARSLPDCRDMLRVVPTIAYQLARFSYPVQAALCRNLGNDPDIGTRSILNQFKKLIMEPLMEVVDTLPGNLVIVIDALDELSDRNGAQLVFSALFRFAATLPVKFFVTCRPEPGLLNSLHSLDDQSRSLMHLHNIEQSIVQSDIETYFSDELQGVSISSGQIQFLAQQSGKLFIYAATVVRYIRPNGLPVSSRKRLATILATTPDSCDKTKEGVNALYGTILAAALETPALEDSEKRNIRLTLGTVICAKEAISLEVISEFLQLDIQDDILPALEPLRSVLDISQSSSLVSPLHASFPEYVLNRERSRQFFCDEVEHNKLLAHRCFDIMRQSLRFNICDLESSFMLDAEVPDLLERVNASISPSLSYSCRYWGDHMSNMIATSEDFSMIEAYVSQYLLFWMEALNLTKRINLGPPMLSKVCVWLEANQAPGPISDMVKEAQVFVAIFSANAVSRSTPHIYMSSLPAWTRKGLIHTFYKSRVEGLIQLTGSAIDWRSSAALAIWAHQSPIVAVAISGNGAWIASASLDGSIIVQDAHDGEIMIEIPEAHADNVNSIAFSPDHSCIASGSSNSTIYVWDSKSGHVVVGPLRGYNGGVNSVAFSHAGNLLISASDDCAICVWDISAGAAMIKLPPRHTRSVLSVAFSPDDTRVVSGSRDKTLLIWDVRVGTVMAGPLTGHEDAISSVVFSADGTLIASGSQDMFVLVWDAESGSIAAGPLIGHTRPVTSVVFSPDGARVISGSEDHTIRIWDVQNGNTISILEGHTYWINSIALSRDGTRIVSGSEDQTIRVWDALPTDQKFTRKTEGHTSWVTSVTFSPDGAFVASGSDDCTVGVWDARTGNIISGPREGHTQRVTSICFSPDGTAILSGSEDSTIRAWELHSEQTSSTLLISCKSQVRTVAYSPNGALVASGHEDHSICIWDTQDNYAMISIFRAHTGLVDSVAFSPDSFRVASGAHDFTVRIQNLLDGSLVGPLEGHTGPVVSVDFSPDGRSIASGASDNTARIWDAESGDCIAGPFTGHTNWVSSVSFSPNSVYVVLGSFDETITVWNAQISMVQTKIHAHHAGQITSVVFSPDGTRIASGSLDCTVRIWDISNEENLGSDPLDDWALDDDGWITDRDSRLLLWVPPDLRAGLRQPSNPVIMSNRGSFGLDFHNVLLGEEWKKCYVQS